MDRHSIGLLVFLQSTAERRIKMILDALGSDPDKDDLVPQHFRRDVSRQKLR
jgi:hypothetical protein